MTFCLFLWALVWGGMFTGIYNIQSPGFTANIFTLFQGLRALLPIGAAYLSALWLFGRRAAFPFRISSVKFLFYYSLLGIISSLFLSPKVLTSLYWVGVYVSPLLVAWVVLDRSARLEILRKLIYMNYAIFVFITVSLFPQAFQAGLGKISHNQFYMLPFGLGEIRSNGVGRYALVVIVVALVRFLRPGYKKRYAWLLLLVPSLLLLVQTQSRTALLGLAVAGILFVLLKGIDWRFALIGPVSAYSIWLSGIKWRFRGQFGPAMLLAGREYTWQKGIVQIKQSPFFGWGFHADRLLLNSEHMHNSYLHAAIHSGIIGTVCFLSALVSFWILIFRSGIFKSVRFIEGPDQALLMESILIVGFLTSRSLFESTGAFYGVDLLLLVPAMAYVFVWAGQRGSEEAEMASS